MVWDSGNESIILLGVVCLLEHYIVGSGLFGAVCWWMGQIGGNLAIADLPVLRCWAGEDIGHTGVFFSLQTLKSLE